MRRQTTQLLILAVAIVSITAAHYLTAIESGFLHNLYQRLYYLPILAAAYWFGVRGAVVVALLSAASYLPHIVTDWQDRPMYRQAQYAELLMFQVVALVVGTLSELEKRRRRELEESFEQLRRADRLSALGELSAGLAHEIKNPLASMKGSLDILNDDFPVGHEKREFLDIFQKELDRLNGVLNEFLQFARTPSPDRQPCSVEDVVSSIQSLCSQQASRAGVVIDVDAESGLPEILADAGQLQQAFLNIVLNGIQAMPDGGRLQIGVARQNSKLEIRVTDQGRGLRQDARSHVFDPFFTTKDGGTGLGLAIAHKLIQGHHGEIQIEDASPHGTTFVVSLPV